MKIKETITLVSKGTFPLSNEMSTVRKNVREAIAAIDWPRGTGTFKIFPDKGKQRGHGNGVTPIKIAAIEHLKTCGWVDEQPWPTPYKIRPGKIDAALSTHSGLIALEWETGNISSSHRSINKICMGLQSGVLRAGILIVPSRDLYCYLTDRVANISELEPYFPLWSSINCSDGVFEIVVVEHDSLDVNTPRIPKGTDGRALV